MAWQQLLEHDGPLLIRFSLIGCALLLAQFLPLSQKINPLYWFSLLAAKMAAKVCRNDRSISQQRIAGALATLLLVLPFWLILLFLFELAAYPMFFEFAVLYCCMRDMHARADFQHINRALLVGDKATARQLLERWTTRDTAILSETGIAKTAIELAVTSSAYGSIAAILFFWIGGVPLVLLAIMLKTLEQSWSPINPRYQFFSRALSHLNHVLFWIPVQACRFSLAIQGGPSGLHQLARLGRYPLVQRGYLQICQMAASNLRIELGGARKYSGIRVMVSKVGYASLPQSADIRRALTLATTSRWFWLGFSLVIPALWILLRLR